MNFEIPFFYVYSTSDELSINNTLSYILVKKAAFLYKQTCFKRGDTRKAWTARY